MNLILTQASTTWSLLGLWASHPILGTLFIIIAARCVLRWFFGITSIRRAQRAHADMLQGHGDLLERQNQLLEQYRSVLERMGEKQ